jgi:hypothetical protein
MIKSNQHPWMHHPLDAYYNLVVNELRVSWYMVGKPILQSYNYQPPHQNPRKDEPNLI